MTSPTLQPDLCVIGASEAGRAVATGAAAMGFSVVVIDDGDPTGRDNRDLMLELLRHEARTPDADPATAWRALEAGLRRAAAERSHARLAAMNIGVIAATARFRDAITVEAGGQDVRARRFVIATGRAQPVHVAGRDALTLTALARLDGLPPALAVIGGDPEAVAAAQSLSRLGSTVSIAADSILPGFDAELTAPLLTRLRQDGVAIADPAAPMPDAPLLITNAFEPALDALAPDRAGIARQGGALRLTPSLRTTNPRVYAVGCPGRAASTAAGLAQVGVVLRAGLLHLPARFAAGRVPLVTATDPEIAQVGWTEETARARGPVRVWRFPFGQTQPGYAAGAQGHVKIVTDRRSRILGAGVVGPQARELIGFWSLALARNLALGDLADVPLPVPAWSEAIRGIALAHAADRLGRPWIRRALGILRRLG